MPSQNPVYLLTEGTISVYINNYHNHFTGVSSFPGTSSMPEEKLG